MNILLIPKIIEPYKDQFEFSVERNLLSFLKKCFKNCKIHVSYNFEFKKKYDLVFLSGGNTIIKYSKLNKDKFREKIDSFFLNIAKKHKIPIIGICHGGHFIASKYKLNLKKDKSHVGAHKIKNLSNINFKFNFVKSFHEYKIEFDKSKFIEKLVLAKDKSVECFKIKKDKIAVVIWHPERETTNVKDQIYFFKSLYSIIR